MFASTGITITIEQKKANVVDTKHGKLIGINKCINCNDFEKDPDDDPMCIKFPICRSEKFAKDIIEAIRGNLCLRDIENLIKKLKTIKNNFKSNIRILYLCVMKQILTNGESYLKKNKIY